MISENEALSGRLRARVPAESRRRRPQTATRNAIPVRVHRRSFSRHFFFVVLAPVLYISTADYQTGASRTVLPAKTARAAPSRFLDSRYTTLAHSRLGFENLSQHLLYCLARSAGFPSRLRSPGLSLRNDERIEKLGEDPFGLIRPFHPPPFTIPRSSTPFESAPRRLMHVRSRHQ